MISVDRLALTPFSCSRLVAAVQRPSASGIAAANNGAGRQRPAVLQCQRHTSRHAGQVALLLWSGCASSSSRFARVLERGGEGREK